MQQKSEVKRRVHQKENNLKQKMATEEIQQVQKEEHNITPTTIQKSVRDLISVSKKVAQEELNFKKDPESMNRKELTKLITPNCFSEENAESSGRSELRGGSRIPRPDAAIENNASGFIIRWKGNCLIKYRRVQIYENIREPQIHQDTRCE